MSYIPEVGEVCEFKKGTGSLWIECKIKYISDYYCVYANKDTGFEKSCETRYIQFRKIKTERERFIEVVRDELLIVTTASLPSIANQLYNSGKFKLVENNDE